MNLPSFSRLHEDRVTIDVILAPGAKRNKIIGPYGTRLKIAIAAPPIDGRANDELLEYLAEFFSHPRSRFSIERGETSKLKTIAIRGLDPQKLSQLSK